MKEKFKLVMKVSWFMFLAVCCLMLIIVTGPIGIILGGVCVGLKIRSYRKKKGLKSLEDCLRGMKK